jgi:hypothetical protein
LEADLERRITDAFTERAQSLPSAPELAPMSPRREQSTRPTRVLVLALVTLLVISAAGVLVAVRRSGDAKGAVQSRGSGAARYRSTAVVSVVPTHTSDVALADPLKLALQPSVRALALKESRVDPHGAPVDFTASANAQHSRFTLAVSAPTGALATSVARSWAETFATVGRANLRKRVLMLTRGFNQQLTTLNRELATVDLDLARLDPANYRNLVQYDEPNGLASTGSQASIPPPSPHGINYGLPPVPEHGTVHELNLAFERIQLLSTRPKLERRAAELRFLRMSPMGPQIVSLTPATLVKPSK